MPLHSPHNHFPPKDQGMPMAPDIEHLAQAHGRAVFHAAYRVLGDSAQAEDVQQGVFMRMLENPRRAKVDHWGAYLCAMATRLAIDEIRRGQRWQRVAERFRVLPKAAEPLPQEVLADDARADRLRRALALLPRRQAQCFALRFFDGLSLEAIAESLSVTSNAVSVSLNRATKALKQRIDANESTHVVETPATESRASESLESDDRESGDQETQQ